MPNAETENAHPDELDYIGAEARDRDMVSVVLSFIDLAKAIAEKYAITGTSDKAWYSQSQFEWLSAPTKLKLMVPMTMIRAVVSGVPVAKRYEGDMYQQRTVCASGICHVVDGLSSSENGHRFYCPCGVAADHQDNVNLA